MVLLALAALPFLLVGLQLLAGGGLVRAFAEAVYPGDPPPYEWRETVWGTLFVVAGGLTTIWGLKEAVRPAHLLRADGELLCLGVSGPLRGPVCLPWEWVAELRAEPAGAGGKGHPAAVLVVEDPGPIPPSPWGARWVDERTLVVDAAGWSPPLEEVMERLRERGAPLR